MKKDVNIMILLTWTLRISNLTYGQQSQNNGCLGDYIIGKGIRVYGPEETEWEETCV